MPEITEICDDGRPSQFWSDTRLMRQVATIERALRAWQPLEARAPRLAGTRASPSGETSPSAARRQASVTVRTLALDGRAVALTDGAGRDPTQRSDPADAWARHAVGANGLGAD